MQRNMMHYRNVLLSPMENCIKQWRIEKYDYRHTKLTAEKRQAAEKLSDSYTDKRVIQTAF